MKTLSICRCVVMIKNVLWWNTAIFHKALDWAIGILYLVRESCPIISQAILILEVCEIWCFLGPKTDPAKGSLVKATSFISDFCYSAFSLKSLCSISCIYSCSWHTGSVLWACGMSSCFCLWIGSYHKNAHSPNARFNTSKSMRKVMTPPYARWPGKYTFYVFVIFKVFCD